VTLDLDLDLSLPSSSTFYRQKPASFRPTWYCSFIVSSSSPEVQSLFTNPTKPLLKSSYNGSFHSSPFPSSKLGLGIIDSQWILSPGSVSQSTLICCSLHYQRLSISLISSLLLLNPSARW